MKKSNAHFMFSQELKVYPKFSISHSIKIFADDNNYFAQKLVNLFSKKKWK